MKKSEFVKLLNLVPDDVEIEVYGDFYIGGEYTEYFREALLFINKSRNNIIITDARYEIDGYVLASDLEKVTA